jgi:hypothetical protein
MKEKISKFLKLFSLMVMLNMLFASCEKDLYEQPTDTSFSPDDAKEWYYSNFKKSEHFKVSSKKNGDKLPDWKRGAYRKIGDFEIIEFPLMKNKKTFPLAKNNSLSDADKRRILNASLARVVFIKNGNNKIELRELYYIPEYKYLQSKGFDISGVDLSKERNDFTGTLIIKTWDSQVLSKRILSNGKIIKTYNFKKSSIANKSSLASKINDCVMVTDQYWVAQCDIEQQGDVWVYTGTCGDWILEWESAPYEVCEAGPGNGCEDSSDPNCQCDMYGLGCDDGGGGLPTDPPVDPPKTPCENVVTENEKAKTILNGSIVKAQKEAMTLTITTDTNEKYFSFGKDVNGQYRTSGIIIGANGSSVTHQTTNPDFTVEGGGHTHTTEVYNVPSPGDIYGLSDANKSNSSYDYDYVFAPDGSAYVLTISNQNDFDNFSTTYPKSDYLDLVTQDWEVGSSVSTDYRDAILQFQTSVKSDDESYELGMAFVIAKYNMGIALSKMDGSGNFIPLYVKTTLDPNDNTKNLYTKTTDCNLK